jgi:hypothetical protein
MYGPLEDLCGELKTEYDYLSTDFCLDGAMAECFEVGADKVLQATVDTALGLIACVALTG